MIKIFYAKSFYWINSVSNLFVFEGQSFIITDPHNLPMPESSNLKSHWSEFYYSVEIPTATISNIDFSRVRKDLK